MPELLNEIPSDRELIEYFELCLEDTNLQWLRTPAEALPENRTVDAVNALLSLQPLGGSQLYDYLVAALFQTMIRLNGLARENPFWQNTNRRPTWFKISEFCECVLRTDPSDELSLRALGALELVAGDSFGQRSWTLLRAMGRFELGWAVCAAYLISGSAPDAVEQLAQFLLGRLSPDDARLLLGPFRLRGAGTCRRGSKP